MDRRSFIKGLVGLAAAIGLPVKALAGSEVVTCHDATMTLNGKRIEPVKWPRTQLSQELIDDAGMPGDGPGRFARWDQSKTGQWHHYALTWQDGEEKVWIDGKQVGPIPGDQYNQRTGSVFGVPSIWHEDA